MRLVRILALVVLLASASQADAGFLLVSTFNPDIQAFDATTGQFDGTFFNGTGLPTQVMHMTFGPNGNLYAGYDNGTVQQIREYNGQTGAFLSVFATPSAGSGVLRFGPDGNLYSSSQNQDIREYNGKTGAFMGVFVPQNLSLQSGIDAMAWGSNGNLYVGSEESDNGGTANIVEYNGKTGAKIGEVVSASVLGFNAHYGVDAMAFGPDGDLYFTKGLSDVLRYDPTTGQTSVFVNYGRLGPALAFGPDGNLYTGSDFYNTVFEFNGKTGAFMGQFTDPNDVGGRVFDLAFSPTAIVPEPSTLALSLSGIVALLGFGWLRMGLKSA